MKIDNEMDRIHKEAHSCLNAFHRLSLDYADWFKRQQHTFLHALKSVQMALPKMVPQEIGTVTHYKALWYMARRHRSAIKTVRLDLLEHFLSMWERYRGLYQDMEQRVLDPLDQLELSVTSWRQPESREKIRALRQKLEVEHSESFIFTETHNETDNLFTYRLSVAEQRLLGLVGFIPYLINYSVKLCFFIERLSVLTVK